MPQSREVGRLLVEVYLKKQDIGYHQFARLVVAFHPDVDGDHCLVEDFDAELREGALAGLARARQELGLLAGAVICQAWTHPVDSHRHDFEACAYESARRHLAQPALRTPPLIIDPSELLEFWRAEKDRVLDSLRKELAASLPRLDYEPNSPDRWSRTRGCRADFVFLTGPCSLSESVSVGFAHRVPEVLDQDVAAGWLASSTGPWPLEALDTAIAIRAALQVELQRRESLSEEEVWRSWLLPERHLTAPLRVVALRELGDRSAARDVISQRLAAITPGPSQEHDLLQALLASL